MARVTAQQFQEKHARNLKNSTRDIQNGVKQVSTAPTSKAADRVDKMRRNLIARFDDGTIERRLRGVSLEDWRGAMLNKGVNNIAGGIDGAKAKVISFAEQLLPAVDNARAKISNMPDLTLDDSINRMTAYIREMSEFRKS